MGGFSSESFASILQAAQAGAGWARTRLYESLAPAVHGYLRTQGVPDPADVTSDVFVAVLTGLPTFRGDERQFRTWVFTIAYRRAVDAWRSRRPAVPAGKADAVAPSAEDEALGRLGSARVQALLDTLTPDQRQVLALRVVADLSLEQVAELVGKPVGAVKALQHRALATLRRTMADHCVQATQAGHGVQATQAGHGVQATQAREAVSK